MAEEEIRAGSIEETRILLGPSDSHLRKLRDAFRIKVVVRNGLLKVSGESERVKKAAQVLRRLLEEARQKGHLSTQDVNSAIEGTKCTKVEEELAIDVLAHGKKVYPKSAGQKRLIRAVRTHDLVFCIGPAGTGKTYLAVALAISALKHNLVKKIVLCRPAVEAGERLGFLPGGMEEKVNPYLRPLYDALHDMMEFGQLKKYMENDLLEVIPLAYMRGRSLNDSFIILDEAQNCTIGQMKMFLTRFGESTRLIITGDITQIDLPPGEVSGLVDACELLKGIRGIEFVRLTRLDIVRHPLVEKIVRAYESRPD